MSKKVKIADLKFDPENARVRTAKGEAMIQESLRQVGAARSIVIDENGTILAGNGTVEAAGQIGIDNVVIVEASGDEIIAVRRKGLTDEQKKKLAYYDNRTGDEAEWDMEQVARDLLGGYDFLDELFDDVSLPTENEWSDAFEAVPDGEKEPFRQMTFTVHDDHHAKIEEAIKEAIRGGSLDELNTNKNGSALYTIACKFLNG